MKINFCSNATYNNEQYTKLYFKGKGIDFVSVWASKNNCVLGYYREIKRDLSEGARLYFEKNKKVDNSVIKFHECGGLTVFFDIPNNEILKISLENPLQYRKHCSEFDIPFLSPIEQYGKTYIVKQPKADTENITKEQCKDVINRIYSNKCELSRDGDKSEQYGLYNGKAYLIDTRCAMPKPNLYTIIVDSICRKINKCYVYISKEQNEINRAEGIKKKGYFFYHIDETPRKSVNFKGGIIKIFSIVKNNIKYRKNHYCIPYEDSKSLNYRLPAYIEM